MRIRALGLGSVGGRFALNALQRGHTVDAYDIDPACRGRNLIGAYLSRRDADRFQFWSTIPVGTFDMTVVCLPTFDPMWGLCVADLCRALEDLAPTLHRNELVSIESTVPIGSTEGPIRDVLERSSGFTAGRDFFLVASPERIDTNDNWNVRDIVKIIGGVTARCTSVGTELYETVVDRVNQVSSARAAETIKLLENAYRFVNISFINEFSELADAVGVDIHEVVRAAATKPFGFSAFWPSVAAGGHCVPAASLSLISTATDSGVRQNILSACTVVNEDGAERVKRMIGKDVRTVLVLGLAYKSGASSFENSAGIRLAGDLSAAGYEVTAIDNTRPEGLPQSIAFVPISSVSHLRVDVMVISAWSHLFEEAVMKVRAERILRLSGDQRLEYCRPPFAL